MNSDSPTSRIAVTVVGGPTALVEWAGLRLLLDPTSDPPTVYGPGENDLTKTEGPAVAAAVPAQHGLAAVADDLGPICGFLLTAPGHPTLYVSGDNSDVAVVEGSGARCRNRRPIDARCGERPRAARCSPQRRRAAAPRLPSRRDCPSSVPDIDR